MLNTGADFYFPDKINLVNNGKGYNYGVEVTLERFLNKGFYYLIMGSLFQSKYKGSNGVWHSTGFNTQFVSNVLPAKEFKINERSSFAIDTKMGIAGGQLYTPFDVAHHKGMAMLFLKKTRLTVYETIATGAGT